MSNVSKMGLRILHLFALQQAQVLIFPQWKLLDLL